MCPINNNQRVPLINQPLPRGGVYLRAKLGKTLQGIPWPSGGVINPVLALPFSAWKNVITFAFQQSLQYLFTQFQTRQKLCSSWSLSFWGLMFWSKKWSALVSLLGVPGHDHLHGCHLFADPRQEDQLLSRIIPQFGHPQMDVKWNKANTQRRF